ncbi:MAG: hypothetical protein NC397_01040 [Clostridium sp.]|nr:hypothetical protein [Clostridium sp.]
METKKKKFIVRGIVIPLIAAVVISAVYIIIYCEMEKGLSFSDKAIAFSEYDVQEPEAIDNIVVSSENIRKSELPKPADGNIIGQAKLGTGSMDILFNGNDVSGTGKLNMLQDSVLFGESGTVYLCYGKADAAAVKAIDKNDEFDIQCFYSKKNGSKGVYKYKVVDKTVVNSRQALSKAGDGIGRGLVIFTDAGDKVGISNKYLAVVCEMTGGDIVVE